jgi:RNA polymerase sigma-70 factor (ECF subfamily)
LTDDVFQNFLPDGLVVADNPLETGGDRDSNPLKMEKSIVGADAAFNKSDAELVRRCRAGDSAAWEQVVHEYSRRVYNLAYRFTNRHEAAEDLAQEVFVRVYRSLDQYDPEAGDLANWLMRLARNLVIDDYRKRGRTPTETSDDLTDHEYHLESHIAAPDRGVEQQERSLQVHAAIAKLPADLRECVILRDIEELSYQEIVEILKIPIGTVKSRINRGRIELAKILRRMKVVETL